MIKLESWTKPEHFRCMWCRPRPDLASVLMRRLKEPIIGPVKLTTGERIGNSVPEVNV